MKAQEKTGPQSTSGRILGATANGGFQKPQRVSKKRKADADEEPESEQEENSAQGATNSSSDNGEKV